VINVSKSFDKLGRFSRYESMRRVISLPDVDARRVVHTFDLFDTTLLFNSV